MRTVLKDIGVPAQRIVEIVAGKRAVTAAIDLRLCRFFGLGDGWWFRGQAAPDPHLLTETTASRPGAKEIAWTA